MVGMNKGWEDDLALVVVTYQYSTSSDRVLDKAATWKGELPGRSLATVMSELRRVHRGATNIRITEIEWRQEDEGGRRTLERRADPGDALVHRQHPTLM